MITKINRKNVKKLLGDGEFASGELYMILEMASDKIRAIYTLFGWSHMLTSMWETNNAVSGLVDSCVDSLIRNPKEKSATYSTAGLSVHMYEDEDGYINVEVKFDIIS